jgi:hypothetical protein
MSVPGASNIGLGLPQQVAAETDEERRKRLLAMQQQRLIPSMTPGASSLGLTTTGYSAGSG